LEQIRSVSYEDATLTVGTTNLTVTSGKREYNVQRDVADETNSNNTPKQLKRITITVTPKGTGANWTSTPVVLVSYRSTLARGAYAIPD
jgi:hypothetical protein